MRLKFLDCEIDARRHSFSVRGEPAHIEPQVYDLLVHLAQNADRLVTREELVERIWHGRIVSDAAIASRIADARRAVGDDGKRQAVIATVPRRGVRFIAAVERVADAADREESAPSRHPAAPTRGIQFCRAADGTRIAWTASGEGPPILRAGHWLTHLEHDRQSPLWAPFIEAFSEFATFVRYDARGNGLSERGVADVSLDALVSDLEAVADAAGLGSFILYATSQGVPVALTFAARHPERVRALILHGGFVRGRLVRSAESRAEGEAYITLMRQGWGAEGSQFLQAFASIFVPDGTPEQIRSLTHLQRVSCDADTAVRLRRAFDSLDVSGLLPSIGVPTLVVHARNDGVHPLSEGLLLTAELPNARLLVLESRDHVLVAHEPAWEVFFAELRRMAAKEERCAQ